MQWFERARMEYHSENPAEYQVLLGLLGNEIKKLGAGPTYRWKIGKSYNELARPRGLALENAGNR